MSKENKETAEKQENDALVDEFAAKLEEAATKAAEEAARKTIDKVSKAAQRRPTVVVEEPYEETYGFKSFGHMLMSMKDAAYGDRDAQEKMYKAGKMQKAAATTYGAVATSADGGSGVPSPFLNEIITPVLETGKIASRVQRINVQGPGGSLTIPIFNVQDMGTFGPTVGNVAGGAAGTAGDGAAAFTQSKPRTSSVTVRIDNKYSLVPVTDQLLEDSVALESSLTNWMRKVLEWHVDEEIVRGSNSNGLINHSSVAGLARDTANAIGLADVAGMWARRLTEGDGLVWLCSARAEAALYQLNSGTNNSYVGNIIQFVPGQGLMLFGAPVVRTVHCNALGSDGDLLLVNLNEVVMVTKGDPKVAVSPHIFFDAGETAYRITFRIGSSPILVNAINDEQDTTVSYSNIVQLNVGT